jgi:hypothetical protein
LAVSLVSLLVIAPLNLLKNVIRQHREDRERAREWAIAERLAVERRTHGHPYYIYEDDPNCVRCHERHGDEPDCPQCMERRRLLKAWASHK